LYILRTALIPVARSFKSRAAFALLLNTIPGFLFWIELAGQLDLVAALATLRDVHEYPGRPLLIEPGLTAPAQRA
jgi:hypothetical protein